MFCTLNLLQGYWQIPLDQMAQEIFTMVTARGVYTPPRVPKSVLNAAQYFQVTMDDVSEGPLRNI